MSYKVHKMFETIKAHVAMFHDHHVSEQELKNQLFQKAMQEARSARSCSGQVHYVQLVDLLHKFVEGLYYPYNHPVADIAFFTCTLGMTKGEEIAESFQKSLEILEESFAYVPFSRKYAYLLGMAKAALIEKRGESLLFVAGLFKVYYQAFAQVMETFCDCR